jgi:hypothetical protein
MWAAFRGSHSHRFQGCVLGLLGQAKAGWRLWRCFRRATEAEARWRVAGLSWLHRARRATEAEARWRVAGLPWLHIELRKQVAGLPWLRIGRRAPGACAGGAQASNHEF